MSEEIQQVNTRLATLETAVAELTGVLKKLTTEEENKQSSTEGTAAAAANDGDDEGQVNSPEAACEQLPGATGSPADINKEYGHIRDTLNRVKLPAVYKLNETSLGINKKDKPAFTVLQRNARYIETGLRLLQVAFADTSLQHDSTQYLEQLGVILQAAISYNQQEYQALVVGSTFDQETTKYFRVMQRSENLFSPQALGNLKLAAEIASVSANRQSAGSTSTPYTRPAFAATRGRGRGRGGYFDRNNRGGGSQHFPNNRPPYFPPYGAGAEPTD